MKHPTDKYLKTAARLLSAVYEGDTSMLATIICSEADSDYETMYKCLQLLSNSINDITDKLKQEGGL
ncbi:MAG: hypothetical protein ACI398_04130 [Clostridium sp.]